MMINKKKSNSQIGNFAVTADNGVKILKNEKKRWILTACYRTKKAMEYKVDGDTNNIYSTWY